MTSKIAASDRRCQILLFHNAPQWNLLIFPPLLFLWVFFVFLRDLRVFVVRCRAWEVWLAVAIGGSVLLLGCARSPMLKYNLDVPAQTMSGWQPGMVEVVDGVVRHAEFLHKAA